MIQCVGSRSRTVPIAVGTCCSTAVQNAIKIKELFPAANVYVLYRDIRTYGFMEHFYTLAREKGVQFIPYDASGEAGAFRP